MDLSYSRIGRASLAALDAACRRNVAEPWAETEEWQIADWPEDIFNSWFNELADLAKVAISQRSGLWMWICL